MILFTRLTFWMVLLSLSSQYGSTTSVVHLSPSVTSTGLLAPAFGPFGKLQSPVSEPLGPYRAGNFLSIPLGPSFTPSAPLTNLEAAAATKLYNPTRPIVPAVVPVLNPLGSYSRFSSAALAASSLEAPRSVLPVASRQLATVDFPFAPLLSVNAKPFAPHEPIVRAFPKVPGYLESHSSLSSAALPAPSLATPRVMLPVAKGQLAPDISPVATLLRVKAMPIGLTGSIVPVVVPVHKYHGPYSSLSSTASAAPSVEAPRSVLSAANGQLIPDVIPFAPPSSVEAKPFGPPRPIVPAAKYFGPYSSLSSLALAAPLPADPRPVLPVASGQLASVLSPFAPLLSVKGKPFGPTRPIVPPPKYLRLYSRLAAAASAPPSPLRRDNFIPISLLDKDVLLKTALRVLSPSSYAKVSSALLQLSPGSFNRLANVISDLSYLIHIAHPGLTASEVFHQAQMHLLASWDRILPATYVR